MTITTQDIENALSNVLDPELNISIVDLGLIYEIHVAASSPDGTAEAPPVHESGPVTDSHVFETGKTVHVVMTLTTLGCPLFNVIEADIKKNIVALGVPENEIDLELVFDPPWSMERMSESAKAMLGI